MANRIKNASNAPTIVIIATTILPSNVAGILDKKGIPFTANGIGTPIITTNVEETILLAKINQANVFSRKAIVRSARHFGSSTDLRATAGIATDLAGSIIFHPLHTYGSATHISTPANSTRSVC